MQKEKRRRVFRTRLSVEDGETAYLYRAIKSGVPLNLTFLSGPQRSRTAAAGAIEFLTKPFSDEALTRFGKRSNVAALRLAAKRRYGTSGTVAHYSPLASGKLWRWSFPAC